MKGGVRQHQPEQRAAGRDGVGDRRGVEPTKQYDRAGRTAQHGGFGVVDVGVAARDVEIANQHRRRAWRRAPCASVSRRPPSLVDAAGQVIAADSFDGDHGARAQRALGGGHGRIRSAYFDRPPSGTTATARSPGRRSVARGSGDPPDRGIRRRSVHTWRTPPSWWPDGRTAILG